MKFRIRNHTTDDIPFLKDMLFEAAYWYLKSKRPYLEEGLSHPEIKKILANWGRNGDTAIIAETMKAKNIGAAWYRFWTDQNHSFGYVNSEIPEIGIAVVPKHRKKGIGNALLTELIRISTENNLKGLSLSVDSHNPARYLYLKHQFEIIHHHENSWIMIRRFEN